MHELQAALAEVAKKLFNLEVEPELSRPDEKFGDYSSNIAMQLAARVKKKPVQIAEAVAEEIQKNPVVEKAEVAGPGFINLWLSSDDLFELAIHANEPIKPLQGQQNLVEFGDPNPFKEMHIGHLYSYIVGDSISSLLEASGAKVKRLSYHGDVGLHVAKAIYGLQNLQKNNPGDDTLERENFLGSAYAAGARAYEDDPAAKIEIDAINQKIYEHGDKEINELYQDGIKLSFDYFDKVLELINVKIDKRYLESQTTEAGRRLVEKNLGKVFEKSDGAVVFKGEKAGLHTRVFLTSQGLPTYETKDLGLAEIKSQDFPGAARSIVITANEQSEYFKVMLAALGQIDPKLAKKTTHLTHGFLSLKSGKMSSREGNVLTAMKLLLETKEAVHKQYPDSKVKKEVTFAAVKYAFLKHRLGTDIAVDIKESIGLEGNSGPYLLYAYARAKSILSKAKPASTKVDKLEEVERGLARKISDYPEVIAKAADELMPHHIANYLYELAQSFNSFYEQNRVIGNDREAIRLKLVEAYAKVLKHGLGLLNIGTPEKM